MKILATANRRGPVNTIAPVVKELIARGHELTVYATGNEVESDGFRGIEYRRISPAGDDYDTLVRGHDLVLAGLSGYKSPDGFFVRAANAARIPTVAVQDQNRGYRERLGSREGDLPALIGVMNDECIHRVKEELGGGDMTDEIIRRIRVVGWTAFDHYAQKMKEFGPEDRAGLLARLRLEPCNTYLYLAQNLHPDTDYMKTMDWTREKKQEDFDYELRVTRAVFGCASDLGLQLAVKPHPGERFEINFTEDLCNKHGFTYLAASACNTQELMLAADSVTAGKSNAIIEACLLDRNTGAILPDMLYEDIVPFPSVTLDAIPYTREWNGIGELMELVTSSDKETNAELAKKRKRFSVDGKASERLVDGIEKMMQSRHI